MPKLRLFVQTGGNNCIQIFLKLAWIVSGQFWKDLDGVIGA